MNAPIWHLYPGADSLADALAQAIARMAVEAIAARGAFHLVLAGGRTPAAAYALLPQYGDQWQSWHLYLGDERCLAPADPERNSHYLTAQPGLGQVPIPLRHRHGIPAELGAEQAALRYASILPPHPFDLVLLGMGEDGHCASLFPGQEEAFAANAPTVLPVHQSPKPPVDRVTLSAARLRQTHALFFLVTGANKAPAIARWRQGEDLPAARVGSSGAQVWIDAEAWGTGS